MRVVPVIDLQHGRVVRGLAGNRARYRPLRSALTDDASPAGIAAAYSQLPGVEYVYVADLDAIAGAAPNGAAFEQIAGSGLKLWVDVGLRGIDNLRPLMEPPFRCGNIAGLVVALETSPGPAAMAELLAAVGRDRCILSLDLKSGRLLTAADCWKGSSPLEIAAQATAIGFRRLIVLDLASVGVYDGGSQLELCAALKAAYPDVEIVSGGGVRDVRDLQRFAAAGCSAVLMASALHDGRITRDDLAALAAR